MHRAQHLRVVVAKIRTRKDLFWSCRDYEDVTAKTFLVFVELHGKTFNHFFIRNVKHRNKTLTTRTKK